MPTIVLTEEDVRQFLESGHIPDGMTGEQVRQYFKQELPNWIEELKEDTRRLKEEEENERWRIRTEEEFQQCLETDQVSFIMSEEQFRRYLEVKVPKWIEEIREEAREEEKRKGRV